MLRQGSWLPCNPMAALQCLIQQGLKASFRSLEHSAPCRLLCSRQSHAQGAWGGTSCSYHIAWQQRYGAVPRQWGEPGVGADMPAVYTRGCTLQNEAEQQELLVRSHADGVHNIGGTGQGVQQQLLGVLILLAPCGNAQDQDVNAVTGLPLQHARSRFPHIESHSHGK